LMGIFLVVSLVRCVSETFIPDKNFSNKFDLQGLSWQCFANFEIIQYSDSLKGLKVITHEGEYPGLFFPWLYGDWNGYHSLCVEGNHFNSETESEKYFLRIFDGKGNYQFNNRFEKKIIFSPHIDGIQSQCFPIENLMTPSQRRLNLSEIDKVYFFGTDMSRPHQFLLTRVYFK